MNLDSQNAAGDLPLRRNSFCFFAVVLLALMVSSAQGQVAPEPQTAPAKPASTTSATTDQAPGTPAPMEQVPGISTNADEVSLDLVVNDKKHNPILDLKPEDLVVTDNGTPVKLTGLHLVKADAGTSHMVTLLFDPFHGPTAKSARVIAEKVLKVLPANGYSFAVFDFTGRLRLLQGFTEDRKALSQAISVVTESQAIVMSSTYTLSVNVVNDKKADEGRKKTASEAEKNIISIAQTGADLSGVHADVKERARGSH